MGQVNVDLRATDATEIDAAACLECAAIVGASGLAAAEELDSSKGLL
jgi:hypothetical protein